MDKDKVHITQHAVNKFIVESKHLNNSGGISDPKKQIRHLFGKAKKQPMDAALVKRIIKNNCETTQYFVAGKWRFVIVNETMVTCERIHYQKPKKRRH